MQNLGLRLLADAGSSLFVARYSGNEFLGYRFRSLGKEIITGAGAELLLQSTAGYYVPLNFTLGVHQGFRAEFGGETRLFFGVNASFLPGL
jgi:hypothetical protein